MREALRANLPTESVNFAFSRVQGEKRYTPSSNNFASVDLCDIAKTVALHKGGSSVAQKVRHFLRCAFLQVF